MPAGASAEIYSLKLNAEMWDTASPRTLCETKVSVPDEHFIFRDLHLLEFPEFVEITDPSAMARPRRSGYYSVFLLSSLIYGRKCSFSSTCHVPDPEQPSINDLSSDWLTYPSTKTPPALKEMTSKTVMAVPGDK